MKLTCNYSVSSLATQGSLSRIISSTNCSAAPVGDVSIRGISVIQGQQCVSQVCLLLTSPLYVSRLSQSSKTQVSHYLDLVHSRLCMCHPYHKAAKPKVRATSISFWSIWHKPTQIRYHVNSDTATHEF